MRITDKFIYLFILL